jgi:MFS transporter, FSR family, fosmidomycin resistance protein
MTVRPADVAPPAPARQTRIIVVIGAAHFMSHAYLMALPPLMPLLRAELGISYAGLGLLVTLFMLASGSSQLPIGFLVDRIGGRAVLLIGLVVQALAIGAVGLVDGYWALVAAFVLAGFGHAVYHPADYAILSAHVEKSRLGRVFSLHAFAGQLGNAMTPALMVALVALWDWRTAFVALGVIGLVVAAAVASQGTTLAMPPATREAAQRKSGGHAIGDGIRLLLSRPLLLCFLFSALAASGYGSLRTFSVAALVQSGAMPLVAANGALTGLLVGAAFGILAGGLLADRFGPRLAIVAFGLGSAAILLFLIASVSLPITALVAVMSAAGFARSTVMSSRDLLVHDLAPDGTHGKAFAFISTGGNLGNALTPVAFGWVLDQGDPLLLFWASGLLILLALGAFAAALRARRR